MAIVRNDRIHFISDQRFCKKKVAKHFHTSAATASALPPLNCDCCAPLRRGTNQLSLHIKKANNTATSTTMAPDSCTAEPYSKARKVMSPFADAPFCMASLRIVPQQLPTHSNTNTKPPAMVHVDEANSLFEESISPLYKLRKSNFFEIVPREAHKQLLLQALTSVAMGECTRKKVRNIEVTTLSPGNSGMPVKRHFDWTVGKGKDASGDVLLVCGERVTEEDAEQRAKDAEFVDFFQNAPIALHWLSDEGNILWANKRELDVLGYTAEEYIGHNIMEFCPDEKELVLEIFKQLGSGNSIRDVPIRFRTKAGKIVHLLIDSNVKYDEVGKFEHTRCFIRDDTPRRIREAKAELLLEETKRSLKMLDSFMSRSLHHMRTPLHVVQLSMHIVSDNLQKIAKSAMANNSAASAVTTRNWVSLPPQCSIPVLVEESQSVLAQAEKHVKTAVYMLDDISDLSRFDQGHEITLAKEPIQLRELGREAFSNLETPPNVEAALELTGGGPTYINSDPRYLKRVLGNLLEHVTTSAGEREEHRVVSLVIGHTASGSCTFAVISTPNALSPLELELIGNSPHDRIVPSSPEGDSSGDTNNRLPAIFSRYHEEFVPGNTCDLEAAGNLRQKIEAGVVSHTKNSLGIGLSLSHHLVASLGGDLRHSAQNGMTRFWFALPQEKKRLGQERIVIAAANNTQLGSRFVQTKVPEEVFAPQPMEVASSGLCANDKPTVLVVEDTRMCAKLLCRVLEKIGCTTKWVENGREAVDELRMNPVLYDLILMDLRMPVMDGFEATIIIKNELQMTTPVVAVTGDTAADIKDKCLRIGFEEVCSKPTTHQDLSRIIRQYVTAPR